MESLLLSRGVPHAFVIALCLLGILGPQAQTAPNYSASAPEITIVSKALGLEFQTPKNWRLAIESTEEELLLYGHSKRTSPLLRIRVFNGRRSPIERLPEMTRTLMESEAKVKTVSADRWQHEGRSFQTARATVKDGSAEYVALFTLVDQPKKVQHAFWLYGKAKEVDKAWTAIQTSIASAKSVGTIGVPGTRDDTEPEEDEEDAPDAWTDKKTRLTLKRWPEGFELNKESRDLLTSTGIVLDSTDTRAHENTWFRVSAMLDQKENAATKASEALDAELKADDAVQGLSNVNLRVAGQPASKHRWTHAGSGGPFVRETYLFQKGTTVYRIEFSAAEAWAKARSRRSLVRDFLAGIRV